MAKAKNSKKTAKAAKVSAKARAQKSAVVKDSAATRVATNEAPAAPIKRDPRLPAPGTVLIGRYKGVEYKAKVLENGFLYDGRQYKSLSAIGTEITQSACNGFVFFRLAQPKRP